MNSIVLNTSYLGPILYYTYFVNRSSVIFEVNENYQKKSYRNKCQIFGSHGVELLSVPLLKGKNNASNIKEVKIAYSENWMVDHLKRIKEAYAKAPYFDYYFDGLSDIINTKHTYLYELNLSLSQWLLTKFQIQVELSETKEFEIKPTQIEDGRLNFNSSINPISWPVYPQVYEFKHGFQNNLSALDLLMNQGPESIIYLKEINHLMT